jgi:hypothetical protein
VRNDAGLMKDRSQLYRRVLRVESSRRTSQTDLAEVVPTAGKEAIQDSHAPLEENFAEDDEVLKRARPRAECNSRALSK